MYTLYRHCFSNFELLFKEKFFYVLDIPTRRACDIFFFFFFFWYWKILESWKTNGILNGRQMKITNLRNLPFDTPEIQTTFLHKGGRHCSDHDKRAI